MNYGDIIYEYGFPSQPLKIINKCNFPLITVLSSNGEEYNIHYKRLTQYGYCYFNFVDYFKILEMFRL